MKARVPMFNCKQKKAIRKEMEREYQKVASEERDGMARRIIKTMIFCLNQEFGFGVGRCARAFKAFTEHLDNSADDEVYWEHIDQVVIDQMKIPFERDYTDRGKLQQTRNGEIQNDRNRNCNRNFYRHISRCSFYGSIPCKGKRRMKHLGDITKINGANVPATMVVIGGSPCQDLSVAGKRAGLAGERSGLFMEQIRVIKEMRKAYEQRQRKADNVKPRYMVWENVPGAFSSNKGADFAAVLEETLKVVKQETPDILVPDKGWPLAGCLYDDEGGWSIAWRVFDAQFWGTPQRRRRIALIADFGGLTAPEILFERKGLSRYTPPSRTAWKDFASFIAECTGSKNFNRRNSDVGNTYCIQGNCIDRADTAGCNGKGWTEGVSYTLNTVDRPAVCNVGILNDQGGQVINANDNAKTSPTLRAEMHGNLPCVYDTRGNGDGTTVPTITGDHNNRVTDYTSIICMATQQGGAEIRTDDKAPTLTAAAGTSGNNQPVVAHGFPLGFRPENTKIYDETATTLCNGTRSGYCNGVIIKSAAVDCRNGAENEFVNGTLQAKESGGSSLNLNNVVRQNSTVRRLTPLECERLQGFPGGWTDIGDYIDTNGKKRKTSDSARYKALGNSIALPSWVWVLERLSYCCGADRTMASLFDGIGGFPLIWEAINGQGTCLWASEIEEFPIAVTKYHFTETK